jgi:hypothetical protein
MCGVMIGVLSTVACAPPAAPTAASAASTAPTPSPLPPTPLAPPLPIDAQSALSVEASMVDKVSVVVGEHPELVFLRTDGKWELRFPFLAPAKEPRMNSLLAALQRIRIGRVLSENSTEEERDALGFNARDRTSILAFSAGEKVMDLWLGRKTPEGQLAIAGDKSQYRVYVVSGWAPESMSPDANSWTN